MEESWQKALIITGDTAFAGIQLRSEGYSAYEGGHTEGFRGCFPGNGYVTAAAGGIINPAVRSVACAYGNVRL